MEGIDPRAFEFVLSQIDDGLVFERFAQDLLCQVIGPNFTPIGGVRDRGIDGLEYCHEFTGAKDTIYQLSIDADPRGKSVATAKKLRENDITCRRLFYVTNQVVRDQDVLQEEIFNDFEISIFFRDVKWLRGNVNKTEGTKKTYLTFIETHCHEFEERGRSLAVTDLDTDPRLFVFLRQQWESQKQRVELDELLADSLILYALEDTDPEKDILHSRSEILERIATYVTFPLGV